MKRVIVLVGVLVVAGTAHAHQYTQPVGWWSVTARNWTGQTAYRMHLGLRETQVDVDTSSSAFDDCSIAWPGEDNVNTLLDYWGAGTMGPPGNVPNGEEAVFQYTHGGSESSVTRTTWVDQNGDELANGHPGNSEQWSVGATDDELLLVLDNNLTSDYVGKYNSDTGQSLTGEVTVAGAEYALTQTEIALENLSYDGVAGLAFTPLATPIHIPLGGEVTVGTLSRDGLSDYVVLRYTVEFTGDAYASDSRVYRATQVSPVPEPTALALLALGGVGMLLRRRTG